MRLSFLGAARQVTGSCFLIESGGKKILIDCGMRQGDDANDRELLFSPGEIDLALVTHAHIDHSGMLPYIVKNGFHGRIIATGATCALLKIMLLDSAYIQEADAQWRARKGKRAGEEPQEPLYVKKDAEDTIKLLLPCRYSEDMELADGIVARFVDAGHLLGSAYIKLTLTENGETRCIVFSGDIGNINQPIIKDPQEINGADFVVMESTYGNRLHTDTGNLPERLADILETTFSRGGNVIIPSFAVGRTQELLYIIREIKEKGLVKSVSDFPVYIDSPLALEATAIYSGDLREYADEETAGLMSRGINPISFKNLRLSPTAADSMRLNTDTTPKVIISSSGMCEAGRIRHHLKHNLWRPECSIVFAGYQANGTLGRILLDGVGSVKLFGERIAVKANIFNFGFLSGHADKNGLIKWISRFEPKPERVFVVHGEKEANQLFTETIKTIGFDACSPEYGDSYDLTRAVEPEKAALCDKTGPEGTLADQSRRILDIVAASASLTKKEQSRFAKQLKDLADYWDKR